MELGGWKDAEKLIDRSLKIEEENYRSIFQKAKIQSVLSQLDEAEANFKRVLEKYPNDRMTLQQLGELSKLKSQSVPADEREKELKISQGYFEKVLEIDPEDLTANYNLMLIYQKLKMREAATEKAKVFRDLKDDPQTTFIASTFLQNNPDVGNESLPYHTHDLIPFQEIWEKQNYLSITDIDWTKTQYFNPITD
jgi:tetratricopeptide (TPR) repeat protein